MGQSINVYERKALATKKRIRANIAALDFNGVRIHLVDDHTLLGHRCTVAGKYPSSDIIDAFYGAAWRTRNKLLSLWVP